MTIFTPLFSSDYNGHLIYNVTNFTIGDELKKYVEDVEIVFDNIYDRKMLGFTDLKYAQNASTGNDISGSISITLTNDVPHWLLSQLVQLSKAFLCGGMTVVFEDWVSDETYYCKWENAAEFSEISAILGTGNIMMKFYQIGTAEDYQDTYGVTVLNWQDTYDNEINLYQNSYA